MMRPSHYSETVLCLKTNTRAACQLIHQPANPVSKLTISLLLFICVTSPSCVLNIAQTHFNQQEDPAGTCKAVEVSVFNKCIGKGNSISCCSADPALRSKGTEVGCSTPWLPATWYRPFQVHLPW